MDFLYIVILSFVSIAVLFILTKLSGSRQISEMSFFDYVIGITIGSIAAEMATNIDLEWWKGITAMTIYALTGILLSFISQKSISARKFISGQPIILIEKGKILRKNLFKAKIEINDLLTSARNNGYFNLADIEYAIMETTGKISFMPIAQKRQLTPKDFNFAPMADGLYINVIIDGKIIKKDLKNARITENELKAQLKDRGVKAENILLATIDNKKHLTIFEK
ncbi:MAG TPA: DUF421 domain-containing protein [Candidatus Eubacterium faecigallinarum]|nr:DUF421 domain-containing protein [Candidatus Eubacterium faecigallinarum]